MKALFLFLLISSFQTSLYIDYFDKGYRFTQQGNYRKAVNYLNQSYNLKQNPKTAYYLALCYNNLSVNSTNQIIKKNMRDSAVICAQRSIELTPKLSPSYLTIAKKIIKSDYTYEKLVMTTEPDIN